MEKTWLPNPAGASAHAQGERDCGVENDASGWLEAMFATSPVSRALAKHLKICMMVDTPKNPQEKGPLRENW